MEAAIMVERDKIARSREKQLASALAKVKRLEKSFSELDRVADGYYREMRKAGAMVEQLKAALKLTEFGFNHARCPVCAGFDGKGENDKLHNATCPVAAALHANGQSGASDST